MLIQVSCPHCDWKGKVKGELAGKKGKCPTCGEVFAIPKAERSAPPPIPGSKKTGPVDVAPDFIDDGDIVDDAEVVEERSKARSKRSVRNRDKDYDDRPRRRSRNDDDEDRPAKSRRRVIDDDHGIPAKRRARALDDDDEPRPRRPRRRIDDDDDRPQRRRPARRRSQHESRNSKRVGAVVGGLICILIGGAWLAWMFFGNGRFRVYPFISVVLGLIGLFQGFTGVGLGGEDSSAGDDDDY